MGRGIALKNSGVIKTWERNRVVFKNGKALVADLTEKLKGMLNEIRIRRR